jgi:amino acid permease
MVAFGLTLQASWEGVAVTFQASLLNGGPVSMVYGMILSGLGSSAMALSLGEMASMYNTIEKHNLVCKPTDFIQGSCGWSPVSMDGSICSSIWETRVLEFDARYDFPCPSN